MTVNQRLHPRQGRSLSIETRSEEQNRPRGHIELSQMTSSGDDPETAVPIGAGRSRL